MTKRNTRRGFTLIELLVVVLIIGILAAVAVPQYQKAVVKVRLTEAITHLNTLQKAIDIYVLEHGYGDNNSIINLLDPNQNYLSIDLPLTCSSGRCTDSSGWFQYGASLEDGEIYAGVNSSKLEGLSLHLFKTATTPWQKQCTADTDLGKYLCLSIQKDGWEPNFPPED